MSLESPTESPEIIPRRVRLKKGESPSTAAIRELTSMGLIRDGALVMPISVRSIPTRNATKPYSNVDRIWGGGLDTDNNLTFFYSYNPCWDQHIQAQGRSYWFVRSDCLISQVHPNGWSRESVKIHSPYKNALVLLLEEAQW